jgi:hypothetical protein
LLAAFLFAFAVLGLPAGGGAAASSSITSTGRLAAAAAAAAASWGGFGVSVGIKDSDDPIAPSYCCYALQQCWRCFNQQQLLCFTLHTAAATV